MDHLRPLFLIYFHLFKQTLQFLQQIYARKCPSSIQCWDSNPQPSEHKSPPITTRPGHICYNKNVDKKVKIGKISFNQS